MRNATLDRPKALPKDENPSFLPTERLTLPLKTPAKGSERDPNGFLGEKNLSQSQYR